MDRFRAAVEDTVLFQQPVLFLAVQLLPTVEKRRIVAQLFQIPDNMRGNED